MVVLVLISVSLYAQEGSNDKWFHLEGVNNPEYKVYLDISNMDYAPGVTITANLKYVYAADTLLSYSVKNIKFIVPKDNYQILTERKYSVTKDGKQQEDFTKSINPPEQHLIPGSEMSVIYQYVYIQAVTIGPTHK